MTEFSWIFKLISNGRVMGNLHIWDIKTHKTLFFFFAQTMFICITNEPESAVKSFFFLFFIFYLE